MSGAAFKALQIMQKITWKFHRYFEERLELQHHWLYFFCYSQWCQTTPQNIILCVQQKKETHTGLQQLEGE